METAHDHRRYAEECIAMAQRSDGDSDKALWLTLAQSWVRLAEDFERSPSVFHDDVELSEEPAEMTDDSSASLD
jgi:hypothetical protein